MATHIHISFDHKDKQTQRSEGISSSEFGILDPEDVSPAPFPESRNSFAATNIKQNPETKHPSKLSRKPIAFKPKYSRTPSSKELSIPQTQLYNISCKAKKTLLERNVFQLTPHKQQDWSLCTFELITNPTMRTGMILLSTAAMKIQNQFRRHVEQRRVVYRLSAVIIVQAFLRRSLAQGEFLYYKAEATKIQEAVRKWKLMNLAMEEVTMRLSAIIRIQTIFRSYMANRDANMVRYAIPQIQTTFRGYMARREANMLRSAIIQMQTVFRGFMTRKEVNMLHSAAVPIQTAFRGFMARNKAYNLHAATVRIQACCRGHIEREAIEFSHYSATFIQAKWRGFLQETSFQCDVVDVIIAQSMVRKKLASRAYQEKVETRNQSATRIQKVCRGFRSYINYWSTIEDIIVAQKIVRHWFSLRRVATKRLTLKRVIIAQTLIRRHNAINQVRPMILQKRIERERLEKKSSTLIQSCYRRFCQQTDYEIMRLDIILIQKLVRARYHSLKFLLQKQCAILMQCMFRMRLAKAIRNDLKSVRLIQSVVRMFFSKKKLRKRRLTKIFIASATSALRVKKSCGLIQTWWKEQQKNHNEKLLDMIWTSTATSSFGSKRSTPGCPATNRSNNEIISTSASPTSVRSLINDQKKTSGGTARMLLRPNSFRNEKSSGFYLKEALLLAGIEKFEENKMQGYEADDF